jgi:hypothetical protein
MTPVGDVMTKHLFLVLALAACTDFDPGKAPTMDGTTSTTEALDIQKTPTGITGTFGDATFTSELVSDQVLDITLHVNGMVITATVDFATGVLETDGYTAATGENTQMTDEDRASLLSLERALAKLDGTLPMPLDKLRGFVATWAEHPTTVDLQSIHLSAENRSWTSLCWAKNSYYPASHDCNTGGFWIDATTLDDVYMANIGDQGGPDGVAWYFPAGGSYQCCSGSLSCSRYSCSVPSAGWYVGVEVDHDTRVEYAYGNCFGVCGAGCPGTWQYTVDCVNHDQCVRNGHITASGYCDDQFTAASDDWASAPDCGP